MNRWWHAWVIEKKFPEWLAQAGIPVEQAFLLQDHERSLWTDEAKASMRTQGITLLENYPKCSQDLNAIENAWNVLRRRLDETLPSELESRDEFTARLRAAVRWVNANRADQLWKFCTDQKERAREVLLREGSRTSF